MIEAWLFFGVVCMQNAPTDCKRVVFDVPRNTGFGYPAPPHFQSASDCLARLPAQWEKYAPLKVMASDWAEFGCTRERI